MSHNEDNRDLTRCLLLDVGGVLVDDIMGDSWLQELSAHSGRSYSEIEQYYLNTLKDPLFKGQLPRETFWRLLSEFLDDSELECSGEQAVVEGLRGRPGLPAVVAWSKRVSVGLLSNHIREWLDSALSESGLLNAADFILVSDETGVRKPNVAAFELAIAESGLEASRLLFVDNQQANLEAAISLGMQAKLADPENEWIAVVDEWVIGADRAAP